MKKLTTAILLFVLEMNKKLSVIKFIAFIVITFFALEVSATGQSQIKVTGIVTDASTGDPLPGVNIVIKNSVIGVLSDINGKYSIEITDPATVLVFSFVGYQQQEIQVAGRTTIDVKLGVSLTTIEEVVVVGYGTQRKINLTGAVSTINTEQLSSIPVSQTSMALQGKLAGVTVTQNFGAPGSDDGTIRIHGVGTLGRNDPLILIDGVEGAMNDINPNDIESISVLKDAASASIYGSRAANGVILIKTKRGNKNEAMSITYNGMAAIQVPTDLPELVNGETYMMLKNENERNSGRPNLYSDAYIATYLENAGKEPYFDTDWFDFSMKPNAMQQQHSLTIKGGSEKITSMVSLSYLDQDALIENTGLKRSSLRTNNTLQASDKF